MAALLISIWPDQGNATKYPKILQTGAAVAGVVLVTQYYKSDPPIVSNNNIWLSASLRFPRRRLRPASLF